LFLKDVGDARRIRNRILACFEAAALPTTTDKQRKQLLNFAIVGGGPTGIEFSAELHDIIKEDMARLYAELIQFHKITVYDVAKKVLPMFDENLAKYAMETFNREGIAIKTNHHVEELRTGSPEEKGASADNHEIYTLKIKEEGEIGVGMVVWSESFHAFYLKTVSYARVLGTGLMQNPFVSSALSDGYYEVPKSFRRTEGETNDPDHLQWRVKTDEKTGSIMTDNRLQLKLLGEGGGNKNPEAILKDVYALGDCAIVEGTLYPATAQVASQKAYWLAKRLNKGDMENSGFTWKNMGVMAYVGNWNALLQGGGSGGISGRLAWIIWRGAYLTKSVSWRNKILIPIYW
jgi:NADH dehydrogenase